MKDTLLDMGFKCQICIWIMSTIFAGTVSTMISCYISNFQILIKVIKKEVSITLSFLIKAKIFFYEVND